MAAKVGIKPDFDFIKLGTPKSAAYEIIKIYVLV